MDGDLFADTSGFYALLVKPDDQHERAAAVLAEAATRARCFVTTDYVLDETVTLLTVRGHGHLVERFLDMTLESQACRTVWMDPARFAVTRRFLARHRGHGYSFTDCFSFTTMAERGIRDALTKDAHFREAGFVPLLA